MLGRYVAIHVYAIQTKVFSLVSRSVLQIIQDQLSIILLPDTSSDAF